MKNIQDLLSRITKSVCMQESNATPKKKIPCPRARMTMELLLMWKNIIGTTLFRYALVDKLTFEKHQGFSKGTVHILVPHHAFGFEIQMQQGLFLQKIQHYLGNDHIKYIKTRVSPHAFQSVPAAIPMESQNTPQNVHHLCLESMKEDPLKEALFRLGHHIV